jgi:hypothetical protein
MINKDMLEISGFPKVAYMIKTIFTLLSITQERPSFESGSVELNGVGEKKSMLMYLKLRNLILASFIVLFESKDKQNLQPLQSRIMV